MFFFVTVWAQRFSIFRRSFSTRRFWLDMMPLPLIWRCWLAFFILNRSYFAATALTAISIPGIYLFFGRGAKVFALAPIIFCHHCNCGGVLGCTRFHETASAH